jgi:hypothetical protein
MKTKSHSQQLRRDKPTIETDKTSADISKEQDNKIDAYEGKIIEDTLKKLISLMRFNLNKTSKYGNSYEYRINRNKIGSFRLSLFELYHVAFKQGVYTAK